MFFPKDFVETAEGLMFALVAQGTEAHAGQDKVLCFLRYVKEASGWKKYSTEPANAFLQQHHPDYLHYSPVLAASLHAVGLPKIVKHHQPKQRLRAMMQDGPKDAVEQDVFHLCSLLQQEGLDLAQTGITGSVLVDVQNQASDIDLVCYDRDVFHACRAITRDLIKQGLLQDLDGQDWQQSYQRRSSALSMADYVWHERRKYNKAVINGRKFDLNFIDCSPHPEPGQYQKCGPVTVQCRIIDDHRAFDYPAEFTLDHEDIGSVVSFTATYTGQAISGERVEVSGVLEQNQHGVKRIVVGSSREAHGEYIKVVRA
ncbi:MAG: hypothetical protein Q7U57_13610 [Methylovulum sp.]|nr:hypothetical protein [Methylovulum sp.]